MNRTSVDFTIVSKPSHIVFICPYCGEESGDVDFSEVDWKTDYWGDGAWVTCPNCGKEVEFDGYEYE